MQTPPLLFAYSTLLPLVWFGAALILSSLFPERRAGAVGTALLIVGAVSLLSWLFVRKYRRHFSRSERWRLIGYCVLWALLLESLGLMYAASAGVVNRSDAGILIFAISFSMALDTLFIWGAFRMASRRVIDSYLQKNAQAAT